MSWIRWRLVEDHGRDPERAKSDARAILKSELLNDPRPAPVQADTTRCFICDEPSTPIRVLVPVLTSRHETPLWLHLEPCQAAHRSRRSVMVDEILQSALCLTGSPNHPSARKIL